MSDYRLPKIKGYKLLEYVQSSGTQWIDTGIIADNNTEAELDYAIYSSGSVYIFGTRYAGDQYFTISGSQSGGTNTNFVNKTSANVNVGNRVSGVWNRLFQKVVTNNGTVNWNATNKDKRVSKNGTYSATVPTLTANIMLFSNGTEKESNGRIYSCKLKQNGTLVRDYVPVVLPTESKIFAKGIRVGTVGKIFAKAIMIRTKNLFDKSNILRISTPHFAYLNAIDGAVAYSSTGERNNYRTIVVPCDPNTTYTVSQNYGNTTMRIGFTEEYPVVGDSTHGYTQVLSGKTITSTSTGVDNYLVCQLYVDGDYTSNPNIFADMLDSIQVEEGSSATPFVPHRKLAYFLKAKLI